jgi:hypothetical protein
MDKLIADTVMMVEPIAFGFNESAAETNSFQNRLELSNEEVQKKALTEFIGFVDLLRSNGIKVIVFKDQLDPYTPDSIFPNNWFATSPYNRRLETFPMANKNRADERRPHIIESLLQHGDYSLDESLLSYEGESKFLEGTGSMVLDHHQKICYACLSPRTQLDVLKTWSEKNGYGLEAFYAYGEDGSEVYHTNVIMTMADEFVVICLDSIKDTNERAAAKKALEEKSKRYIIEITMDQMNNFAGNMLQLKNEKEEKFLIMSESAYDSLTDEQIYTITDKFNNSIIATTIPTIETIGGGSARCMIAEIF